MGRTKEMLNEDFERAGLLDSVYLLEQEMDIWRQIEEEESRIRIVYGRKEGSDLRETEIRIKKPRFLKRIKRGLPF